MSIYWLDTSTSNIKASGPELRSDRYNTSLPSTLLPLTSIYSIRTRQMLREKVSAQSLVTRPCLRIRARRTAKNPSCIGLSLLQKDQKTIQCADSRIHALDLKFMPRGVECVRGHYHCKADVQHTHTQQRLI